MTEYTDAEINTSLLTFARKRLGLSLYDWQIDAISPFDDASLELILVSLATPNGSGKSAIVIPTLVLGWLAVYPRGRVVLTTADGKQLDGQVMPAIESFRARFPAWKFIEREVTTPTGGRFVAFTTDQAGRAEGWHKGDDLDSPLLMIVDEAKTVPDEIFSAIDRCTFNALLLTSSPGKMTGRFYDSQFKPGGKFIRLRVGLADCPHIGQDKIDRIVAEHGPDSPFTRSTLHGEFMEADAELRFNREGLDRIKASAETFEAHWRAQLREHPEATLIGELHQQEKEKTKAITWLPDYETGWLWCAEKPRGGCRYIGFCDPMTGAQSEGSLKRDTHAAGILRLAYTDFTVSPAVSYDGEVVAVLHHPDGCRWDNDILAERFALLLHWYQCVAIVEANNSGTEVMRLLMLAGCNLWRRRKRDHKNPGKKLEVVGFQTTAGTKSEWIGALGRAIREQDLTCNYLLAARQFCTFVLNEKGTGEAQGGAFDDFVTGVGLALYARESASVYPLPAPVNQFPMMTQGPWGAQPARPPGYGACS